MKRTERLLTFFYRRAWGRILTAALMTAAALAAFTLVQQITFMVNDDNAIAFTLAGYHTGTPSPYALFTNCIVGFAVSGLYTAFPAVPWWAALQIVAIAVSCTALGAVLLREGARRELPMWLPAALFLSALLILCLRTFVEPTYTVTAALLGAAGVTLVLTGTGEACAKTRVALDLCGAAALVTAFLIREETGYAVLCFFFAACAYRVLAAVCGREKARAARQIRSACILLAAVLAVCAGAFGFNRLMHTRENGASYETFFRYRERFTDYPRPSYDEAPELYASVGWDQTVYDLADHWCFMDERINAEALHTITATASSQPSFYDAARACVDVIDNHIPARLTVAFLLVLLTAGLYGWLKDRSRGAEFALLCAILLGGAALCLYLSLSGRFLPRTFSVVAIPAAASSCVLCLRLLPHKKERHGGAVYAVFAALTLVLALCCGTLEARELRRNSPKYLINDSRAVIAYVMLHPENVYVRDTFVISDVDAFSVYPQTKPVNLISWGGCEMHSAEYRRQLAVNGVTDSYADMFRQQNVFFLTRVDSSEEAAMQAYLKETYGATLLRADEVTETIAVYRVEF